jgi:adenylate kinase
VILLMGLPGSGKGTQGKMLADEHGLHLISMGDLVRMYVTGERRHQMLAGRLLDDEEITGMLDRVLRTMEDDDDCVLDGFPRTIPQAEWLMKEAATDRFTVDSVVHLVVSPETLTKRLMARGRLDDKEAVIQARFEEYNRLTQPVIDWFAQQGVPVVAIDGEGTTDAVNRAVVAKLGL